MNRDEVIEILERIDNSNLQCNGHTFLTATEMNALRQAISLIKENAELRKEKDLWKDRAEALCDVEDNLREELTELKAKYEELEKANPTKFHDLDDEYPEDKAGER